MTQPLNSLGRARAIAYAVGPASIAIVSVGPTKPAA